MKESFEGAGILEWKDKLVGIGADGASVNLGKKGGVAALLRRDVPYLIDFHCLPHRLELALLEMQRSCRQVEIIYEVLQMIWKTYHYSPKSTRELQAIGNELGVSVLKPTQVSGTRWLPHISRALKVLITPNSDGSGQYAAVLCHMEHLSATSKNADIKGRAKFVSEKMRSVSFAAFCHFLADMFAIISKLSLKMQRNDLILPVAVALLHETIANVDALKLRPVPNGHLKRFMNMLEESGVPDEVQFQGHTLKGSLDGTPKRGTTQTDSFKSLMIEAIELCQSALNERFGSMLCSATDTQALACSTTSEVVNDMLIFNVDAWPRNTQDLVDFGNNMIDRLTSWFKPTLQKAGCDVDSISEEWFSLKVLVNTTFRDKDYTSVWEIMLTKLPYKEDFKNLLHLVEIMLVQPISAAQCERAISAQNRVKNSLRVALGSSTLEDLIRITAEGPSVEEFNPAPVVDKGQGSGRKASGRKATATAVSEINGSFTNEVQMII